STRSASITPALTPLPTCTAMLAGLFTMSRSSSSKTMCRDNLRASCSAALRSPAGFGFASATSRAGRWTLSPATVRWSGLHFAPLTVICLVRIMRNNTVAGTPLTCERMYLSRRRSACELLTIRVWGSECFMVALGSICSRSGGRPRRLLTVAALVQGPRLELEALPHTLRSRIAVPQHFVENLPQTMPEELGQPPALARRNRAHRPVRLVQVVGD